MGAPMRVRYGFNALKSKTGLRFLPLPHPIDTWGVDFDDFVDFGLAATGAGYPGTKYVNVGNTGTNVWISTANYFGAYGVTTGATLNDYFNITHADAAGTAARTVLNLSAATKAGIPSFVLGWRGSLTADVTNTTFFTGLYCNAGAPASPITNDGYFGFYKASAAAAVTFRVLSSTGPTLSSTSVGTIVAGTPTTLVAYYNAATGVVQTWMNGVEGGSLVVPDAVTFASTVFASSIYLQNGTAAGRQAITDWRLLGVKRNRVA